MNTGIDTQHNNSRVDVVDTLLIIIKHRLFIIKFSILVIVISTAIAFALPIYFSATAKIVPTKEDNGFLNLMMAEMSGGLSNLASNILGGGSLSDYYIGVLDSDTIKDNVIDKFHLIKYYNKNTRQDTYKTLDQLVNITAGKKDGIISITVEDKDPNQAAALANAYVDELTKFTIEMSSSTAGKNAKFIEARLLTAKSDLSAAEDKLAKFQSRYKALDLPEQTKGTIGVIGNLMAQLALQETQLAVLKKSFTDAAPEVTKTKASIITIKNQIDHLESKNPANAIPSIGSIPGISEQYIKIMREFKKQETLVELLTKQYEMTLFSEAKDVSPIHIIQTAKVPDKKTRPKRFIIIIVGSILGVIVSILKVFIIDEHFSNLSSDEKARWHQLKRIAKKDNVEVQSN